MVRLGNCRARLGGALRLLIRRQSRLSRRVKCILVTSITVTTLVTSVATASAQNIFEALFGRLWSSPVTSYADPNAPFAQPRSGPFRGRRRLLRAPVRRTLLSNSTS
jgi:hypothetical protein